MYDRVKEHENSLGHKNCVCLWRECEVRLKTPSAIENHLDPNLTSQLLDCSLHGLSDTRLSSKIQAIEPFKNNLKKIVESLEECQILTLTAKVYAEVQGAIKYMSFECCLMSCIWTEVLSLVDTCNQIIQKRDATLDVAAANVKVLMDNLENLNGKWDDIVEDAKSIATNMQIEPQLPAKRASSHLTDEEQLSEFKRGCLQ